MLVCIFNFCIIANLHSPASTVHPAMERRFQFSLVTSAPMSGHLPMPFDSVPWLCPNTALAPVAITVPAAPSDRCNMLVPISARQRVPGCSRHRPSMTG